MNMSGVSGGSGMAGMSGCSGSQAGGTSSAVAANEKGTEAAKTGKAISLEANLGKKVDISL